MPDLELSITICSWNTQTDLRDCLKSLERVRDEVAFEILVCDNNSEDAVKALRKRLPNTYIEVDSAAYRAGTPRAANLKVQSLARLAAEASKGKANCQAAKKALAIIESLPHPVFIHCQHGCDRTGTIIACYRIRHEQWSGKQALQEARHYGISMFARKGTVAPSSVTAGRRVASIRRLKVCFTPKGSAEIIALG